VPDTTQLAEAKEMAWNTQRFEFSSPTLWSVSSSGQEFLTTTQEEVAILSAERTLQASWLKEVICLISG